jgi:hypothetical protein
MDIAQHGADVDVRLMDIPPREEYLDGCDGGLTRLRDTPSRMYQEGSG